MLSGDLDGWDGGGGVGGRFKREGMYVYTADSLQLYRNQHNIVKQVYSSKRDKIM